MSQIGCVHVGIYPTISHKEYLHILSHSDSRILIVSGKELYYKLLPLFKKTPNLEEIYTIDEVEGAKNWWEIADLGTSTEKELRETLVARSYDVQLDDLLTRLYTFGTTGTTFAIDGVPVFLGSTEA